MIQSIREDVYRLFPSGASGKESACQCRRHKRRRFDPWVRKILCRKKWQPTPVFLSGKIPRTEKPGGLQSMGLQKESHTTEATEHALGRGEGG